MRGYPIEVGRDYGYGIGPSTLRAIRGAGAMASHSAILEYERKNAIRHLKAAEAAASVLTPHIESFTAKNGETFSEWVPDSPGMLGGDDGLVGNNDPTPSNDGSDNGSASRCRSLV